MRCVVCGESPQWCLGHGEIGDPRGAAILGAHDNGDHTDCHPAACEHAPILVLVRGE